MFGKKDDKTSTPVKFKKPSLISKNPISSPKSDNVIEDITSDIKKISTAIAPDVLILSESLSKVSDVNNEILKQYKDNIISFSDLINFINTDTGDKLPEHLIREFATYSKSTIELQKKLSESIDENLKKILMSLESTIGRPADKFVDLQNAVGDLVKDKDGKPIKKGSKKTGKDDETNKSLEFFKDLIDKIDDNTKDVRSELSDVVFQGLGFGQSAEILKQLFNLDSSFDIIGKPIKGLFKVLTGKSGLGNIKESIINTRKSFTSFLSKKFTGLGDIKDSIINTGSRFTSFLSKGFSGLSEYFSGGIKLSGIIARYSQLSYYLLVRKGFKWLGDKVVGGFKGLYQLGKYIWGLKQWANKENITDRLKLVGNSITMKLSWLSGNFKKGLTTLGHVITYPLGLINRAIKFLTTLSIFKTITGFLGGILKGIVTLVASLGIGGIFSKIAGLLTKLVGGAVATTAAGATGLGTWLLSLLGLGKKKGKGPQKANERLQGGNKKWWNKVKVPGWVKGLGLLGLGKYALAGAVAGYGGYKFHQDYSKSRNTIDPDTGKRTTRGESFKDTFLGDDKLSKGERAKKQAIKYGSIGAGIGVLFAGSTFGLSIPVGALLGAGLGAGLSTLRDDRTPEEKEEHYKKVRTGLGIGDTPISKGMTGYVNIVSMPPVKLSQTPLDVNVLNLSKQTDISPKKLDVNVLNFPKQLDLSEITKINNQILSVLETNQRLADTTINIPEMKQKEVPSGNNQVVGPQSVNTADFPSIINDFPLHLVTWGMV